VRDNRDYSNLLYLFKTLATSIAIIILKDLFKESRVNILYTISSENKALSSILILDN
jgi:hypothetical protein